MSFCSNSYVMDINSIHLHFFRVRPYRSSESAYVRSPQPCVSIPSMNLNENNQNKNTKTTINWDWSEIILIKSRYTKHTTWTTRIFVSDLFTAITNTEEKRNKDRIFRLLWRIFNDSKLAQLLDYSKNVRSGSSHIHRSYRQTRCTTTKGI